MNEQFKVELTDLINKYSLENGSNTPDFILAEHLCECLETFNRTAVKREYWYNGGLVDRKDNSVFTTPVIDQMIACNRTEFSAEWLRDYVRKSRAIREDLDLNMKTTDQMLSEIEGKNESKTTGELR